MFSMPLCGWIGAEKPLRANESPDDFAKSGADDDTDGKIDHIAFNREFLEFLEHTHVGSLGWS